MPRYEFSAITHPGLVRPHNEDSYVADVDLGLWVVADGMGGHESGEVASAIASATIRERIARGASLRSAITAAHRCIQSIGTEGNGAGMGTTVVALRLTGRDYELAWVGDSRAYLFDGTALVPLSRDHSLVQELVDAGAISEVEAHSHPQRHVITQSVGIREMADPMPDVTSGKLTAGNWVLLCSDGLTGELADDEIARLFAESRSLREATQNLLNQCLDRGARDNVTIVLVEAPAGDLAGGNNDGWLRRVTRRFGISS